MHSSAWAGLSLSPLAVILAGITIIGLLLAILTAAAFTIVGCFSSVPFSIWLGRRLLGARARAGRQGVLINFLIGEVLLVIVAMIPVVGPIVSLVVGCLGLGAIMLGAKALRERQPV